MVAELHLNVLFAMSKQLNAYILTGGSSRRFGSDKAVCMVHGDTFLDNIHKTLQTNFTHIYSVGKKPYSDKLKFISDFSDYQAAMVGIITALRHTSSPWNFFISVDMPLITSNVVYALKKEIVRNENKIIISSINGKISPLFCFYHRDCLVHFEKAFSVENYTLMDVISSLNPEVVDLSHFSMELTNINTQEQLHQVLNN
jgi:molybdopterin-guanine dinucleotide biosynthesis protein A